MSLELKIQKPYIYQFRIEASQINAGGSIPLALPRLKWNVISGFVRYFSQTAAFNPIAVTIQGSFGDILAQNTSSGISTLNGGFVLVPEPSISKYTNNAGFPLVLNFNGISAGDGFAILSLFAYNEGL